MWRGDNKSNDARYTTALLAVQEIVIMTGKRLQGDTIMDANRRYTCLRCEDLSEGDVGPRFESERKALIHLRHMHGDVNDGRLDIAVNVGDWPDG